MQKAVNTGVMKHYIQVQAQEQRQSMQDKTMVSQDAQTIVLK